MANEAFFNHIRNAFDQYNNSDRDYFDLTQYLTGSGNYTVGSNIYKLDLVVLVGGGGGGAGGTGGPTAGGGGGSGALIYFKNLIVTPGQVIPYAVGAGGTGGIGGGAAATNGGDTTFGSGTPDTALTANGGSLGSGATGGAGGVIVPASAKLQNIFFYGSYLKTDLIYRDGQAGGNAASDGGALALDADGTFNFIYAEGGGGSAGGGGGAGFVGTGGGGGSGTNDGGDAPDRGGAGGGGAGASTTADGGDGADGLIYVFTKRIPQ
jgi:hypothetical protein